jgi:membrane-associated phospholipid phosphatase
MRPGVKAPAFAALACAVALGGLLVIAYSVSPFPKFDALALTGFESLRGPFADDVLTPFARTADPVPLAAFLVALGAGGWLAGRRRQVGVAILTVIGANLTTQVLKVVLAHPRFHDVLSRQIGAASFPSGHATAAMSMALAAVIVASPRWRPTVGLLGCAYALALVVSILILGWHYPSDTLGGLLVAAGFAFGGVAISRELSGRGSELTPYRSLAAYAPPRSAWLALAGVAAIAVLARAAAVASFAHTHTSAAAFAAVLAAACIGLTVFASLLADR